MERLDISGPTRIDTEGGECLVLVLEACRMGDEALEAYEQALELDPELADARYNRDLLRQWISEHRKSPPQPQNRQAKDQPSPQDSEPLLKQIAEEPGNLMQKRLLLQSQKRLVREPKQTW